MMDAMTRTRTDLEADAADLVRWAGDNLARMNRRRLQLLERYLVRLRAEVRANPRRLRQRIRDASD